MSTLSIKKCFTVSAALLTGFSFANLAAADQPAQPVIIENTSDQPVPVVASRIEMISHTTINPVGLSDQQVQNVTFSSPITTSLLTVANLSGSCHTCQPGQPTIAVAAYLQNGSSFFFQQRADQPDITLSLTQQIPISRILVRCDAFNSGGPICKYQISLVGN